MATIYWLGRVQSRPQVSTLTITASAIGGTVTLTINGKDVAVTNTTVTAATGAAEALAALQASPEGEFQELTFDNPAAAPTTVTITGPADGAPFTITKADAGGSTSTLTTTTAPRSPHDVNDPKNYSTSALPVGGDTVVFENSDVSALYNLSALTAVAFNVTVRDTFTGTIGLPDTSANGYREYRATRLETQGTALLIEVNGGAAANAFRIKSTGGPTVTATVIGGGAGGTPGDEPVELTGFGAASNLSVSGAGVAVAPLQGDACTVTTLKATAATLRLGPGAAVTNLTLTNTSALLHCGYTTLTMDRGGTLEVVGTGAGTTTQCDAGSVVWRSTGSPGAITLGSDATFDATLAPASFAVGAVTMAEGSSYLDPGARTGNAAVTFTRCGVGDVTLDLGTAYTLTKS